MVCLDFWGVKRISAATVSGRTLVYCTVDMTWVSRHLLLYSCTVLYHITRIFAIAENDALIELEYELQVVVVSIQLEVQVARLGGLQVSNLSCLLYQPR